MSEVARGLVIGRDRELERLRAVLDAPSAWPAALLLEGGAGAGKTVLWSAGVELAREHRVLRARPTGAEAQLAFSALGEEEEPGADLRAVGSPCSACCARSPPSGPCCSRSTTSSGSTGPRRPR